ncbi:unnamed protein product [Mytilus coruscus]|uniref:CCHC-type domain-containing protein n=1 Tax=Mytilus coruscus TaxID=42192 RepID=A0A6J8EW99_MYTCO|nr:unnamed protein product [Mytilus coruscus]
METENDGYDGYQYETNSQDGDSQYGDGITINKSIARNLTAKIIKTSPLHKEDSSNIIQNENVEKITTTDILTHFQTIINVSDLIICLQRINQEQYLAGVRIVRIASLEKPIPRKIYIQGQLVTIRYEGQQNLKKCYKCNDNGHISHDCGNEPKRRWEQQRSLFPSVAVMDTNLKNVKMTKKYIIQITQMIMTIEIKKIQTHIIPLSMLKQTVKIQTILAISKFCSFDSGIRYFGQGFPSPPKTDIVENTEEFVTKNITYENNWENEESWEQDTQDNNSNKQEILQKNELQIGEIIEISCEPKEKTVEADETENTYVFTENKLISEAKTVDIVEKRVRHRVIRLKKMNRKQIVKLRWHIKGHEIQQETTKSKRKQSTLLMLSILKIISVNIRRSFETKIDGIIKVYGDCEIICLQERGYIKQNVISDLENNTDFNIYISQGEMHTKGVVTLVKKDIECTNHYFSNHVLKGNRGAKTRIDKVCISEALKHKIRDLKHIPYQYSDHKIVSITLKLQKTKWGNGYCKMNDSLLDKEIYIEYINNFWINWKQRKCNYNILDWWENGKKKIKEMTIHFSKKLVARERKELSDTYIQLENEENKTQPDQVIIDNLSEIIIKLEKKGNNGQEKRGDKREEESVLDINGKSCISKSEVIKVVTDFYSDLYKSQNIDRQSMTDYLDDLDLNKLTEEDKTNFDTFISQDECLKLLKEFKNNKSPGVDGIGKSFYSKFWNIIREDLVEVLNNMYLNGELTDSMKTGLISLIYKNKGNRKNNGDQ